jgi:hypothetical protein
MDEDQMNPMNPMMGEDDNEDAASVPHDHGVDDDDDSETGEGDLLSDDSKE